MKDTKQLLEALKNCMNEAAKSDDKDAKVGNEDLCMVQEIRDAVLNNERNATYYGEQ